MSRAAAKPFVTRGEASEQEEARNPNTTPKRLAQLVHVCPLEVMSNEALFTVALERPDLYQWVLTKGEELIATDDLQQAVGRLLPQDALLFAADCVERLLPWWTDVPEWAWHVRREKFEASLLLGRAYAYDLLSAPIRYRVWDTIVSWQTPPDRTRAWPGRDLAFIRILLDLFPLDADDSQECALHVTDQMTLGQEAPERIEALRSMFATAQRAHVERLSPPPLPEAIEQALRFFPSRGRW